LRGMNRVAGKPPDRTRVIETCLALWFGEGGNAMNPMAGTRLQ